MGNKLLSALRNAWERDRREIRGVIATLAVLLVGTVTAIALFLVAFTETRSTYCGEDHTHTLQCYSNPNADTETSTTWERTLPTYAQGTPRITRLVSVALSQVGYAASTNNYLMDGDVLHGYTRYGAWDGDPYEEWNAAFVDFCLYYAGIDAKLLGAEESTIAQATTTQKTGNGATGDKHASNATKQGKDGNESEAEMPTLDAENQTKRQAGSQKSNAKAPTASEGNDAAVTAWMWRLAKAGLYVSATHKPAPGELVFVLEQATDTTAIVAMEGEPDVASDGANAADATVTDATDKQEQRARIAIITSIDPKTRRIHVAMGDVRGKVAERAYFTDDPAIIAYGKMPDELANELDAYRQYVADLRSAQEEAKTKAEVEGTADNDNAAAESETPDVKGSEESTDADAAQKDAGNTDEANGDEDKPDAEAGNTQDDASSEADESDESDESDNPKPGAKDEEDQSMDDSSTTADDGDEASDSDEHASDEQEPKDQNGADSAEAEDEEDRDDARSDVSESDAEEKSDEAAANDDPSTDLANKSDKEDQPDDTSVPQVLVAQEGDYTVAVDLAGKAKEGYSLKVEQLRVGKARLASVEQGLTEELPNGVTKVAHVDAKDVVIFDITVLDKDGKKVALSRAVRVSVTPPEGQPSDAIGAEAASDEDGEADAEQAAPDDSAAHEEALAPVPEEVTPIPDVIHLEGAEPEHLDVSPDSNETGFSFTTKGLSPFAFVYTVDFEYKGFEWSMAGGTTTKLSKLLRQLKAVFGVEDVTDAEFSNDELVRIEREEAPSQDWLIKSLQPFHTQEVLTLTLTDGSIATIGVTDDDNPQGIIESEDNERNIWGFLERVEFYDGEVLVGDSSGPDTMVVRPGHEYTMYLHFKEDEDGGQFPDDGYMYYGIPEGVVLSPKAFDRPTTVDGKTAYETEFDIVIDKKHTLSGNTVTYVPVQNGVTQAYLRVKWNDAQADNYKLLKASPRTAFKLKFPWTVMDPGDREHIPFGKKTTLDVQKDPLYGVDVEKTATTDSSDPETIHYQVEAISDGNATDVMFSDVMGEALTYVGGSFQIKYMKRTGEDSDGNPIYTDYDPSPYPEDGQTNANKYDWHFASGGHGFDFKLHNLNSGDKAVMTYDGKVDYTKLGGKNNIEVTSKNTVTATDSNNNVLDEDSQALDPTIDYLQIGKKRGTVKYMDLVKDDEDDPDEVPHEVDITSEGNAEDDGHPIGTKWDHMYVKWEVIYNPDHQIHVEGATLTDTVYMGKKFSTSYVTGSEDMPFTVVAYDKGTFVKDDGRVGDTFTPASDAHRYEIITPNASNGYGWDDVGGNDVTVTEPDSAKQRRASWEWKIPQQTQDMEGQPLTYVITYWTKIDREGPDTGGYVGNQVTESIADITRDKAVELPGILPSYEIEVGKEHVIDDYADDGKVYTQWKVSFYRYGAMERAIVEDTLPHILVRDAKGNEHVCADSFVNEGTHTMAVTNLIDGEVCIPSVSADGYDVVFWFFKSDPGLASDESPTINTPGQGLKAPTTGMDEDKKMITITFWTENDQEWIEATSNGIATPEHWNHVHLVLNGKENANETYAVPKPKQEIKKRVEEVGSWTNGDITLPVYRYTLSMEGLTDDAFKDVDGNKVLEIEDDFDTNLVYLPVDSLPAAGGTSSPSDGVSLTLKSRETSDETLVRTLPQKEGDPTWDATFPTDDSSIQTVNTPEDGDKRRLPITITVTPEQQEQMKYQVMQYSAVMGEEPVGLTEDVKDEEGNVIGTRPVMVYGKSYEVSYYLAPDFTAIKNRAQDMVENNSQDTTLTFKNKATWHLGNEATNSSFSAASRTYNLNPVQKESSYNPDNELANYTIVINPLRLKLNNGERYSVQDEYENLAVDFQTVKFTTVPAGREKEIEWSYHNNRGTFWVPDETKVTVEYEGWPVGNRALNGTVNMTNTATAGVYKDNEPRPITLAPEHEGTASSYRVRIFKFENNNMDRPLEGAVFQLYEKDASGNIVPMRYKRSHTGSTDDDIMWQDVNTTQRVSNGKFDPETNPDGYFPTPENHSGNNDGTGDYIFFVTGDYGNTKHYDGDTDERNTEQWGFAEVMLSQSRDGVALKKNKQYYLKEVLTPEGHIGEDIYWRFIIGESDDWDSYVYSDNSILQVSNASADRVLTVRKSFVDRTVGSRIKYDPDQKDIQFRIVGTDLNDNTKTVYSKTATYSDFKRYQPNSTDRAEYLLIIRELPPGNYTVSEVRSSANVTGTQLVTYVDATATTVQVDEQGEEIDNTQVDQDVNPENDGGTTGDGDTAFHFTVLPKDETDPSNPILFKTTAEAEFTNIYTDHPPVSINVSKTWLQGERGEAVNFVPVKAEFALYANGKKYDLLPEEGGNDRGNIEIACGDNDSDGWLNDRTISNLPSQMVVETEGQGSQTVDITWTVKEVSATYHTDANGHLENTTAKDEYLTEHFTVSQADPTTTVTEEAKLIDVDFTNTFNNLATVKVQKDWTDDALNAALHAQDPVYFDLYRTTDSITDATDLRAVVQNAGGTPLTPVITNIELKYDANPAKSFTYENELMEKTDSATGSDWHYFVLEHSVAGYDDTYSRTETPAVTQEGEQYSNARQELMITNSPQQVTGTITLKKNVVGASGDGKTFEFTLKNSGKYLQVVQEGEGSTTTLGTDPYVFQISASDADGITIAGVPLGTYELTELEDAASINGKTLTTAVSTEVNGGAATAGTVEQTNGGPTSQIVVEPVTQSGGEGEGDQASPTTVATVTNTYAKDESPESKTDYTFGKLWVMPNTQDSTTLPWPNDTNISVQVNRRLKNQGTAGGTGSEGESGSEGGATTTPTDVSYPVTYTISKSVGQDDLVTLTATSTDSGAPTLTVINPDVKKNATGALVSNDMSYHHYQFRLEGLDKYDENGNEWEYYVTETSVKGKDKNNNAIELLEGADGYDEQNDAGKKYTSGYGVVNGIGAEVVEGMADTTTGNANVGYAINRIQITDEVVVPVKKFINGWPNWGDRDATHHSQFSSEAYTYPEFTLKLYYADGKPVMLNQTQKLDDNDEPEFDEDGQPVMEGGEQLSVTTDASGQATFVIPDDAIDHSELIWWSDEKVLYGTQSFWIKEVDPYAPQDQNGTRDPAQDPYLGIGFTSSSARVLLTVKYDWLNGTLNSTASIAGNQYTDANGKERGVINNSYDPGTTQVTVKKTWTDDNNQDGYRRQAKFKVNAYYETQETSESGDGGESGETTTTVRHDIDTVWNVKKVQTRTQTATGAITYVTTLEHEEIILNDTSTPRDPSKEYRITLDPPLTGNDVTKTVTLPKYYEGHLIHYSVEEVLEESVLEKGVAPAADVTLADKYTHTSTESTTVAGETVHNEENTHTPEKVNLHYEKQWAGNDASKDDRTVTVQLKASYPGTVIASYAEANANSNWWAYANEFNPVTIQRDGDSESADFGKWLASWSDLPRYAPGSGGKQVKYTIEEVQSTIPVGYHQTVYTSGEQTETVANSGIYDQSIDVTNEYELVNIPIKKVWVDDDNRDNVRPASITYTLSAKVGDADHTIVDKDGQVLTSEELKKSLAASDADPNDANAWQGDGWQDLPKYYHGEEIEYVVSEDEWADNSDNKYEASETESDTSSIANAANGTATKRDLRTITNTHEIYTTQIALTKKWFDMGNQDGERPSPVDFVNGNLHFYAQLADADSDPAHEVELKVGSPTGEANTYYLMYDDPDDSDSTLVRYKAGVVTIEGTAGGVDAQTNEFVGATDYTVTYKALPRYRDVGTQIVYTMKETQSGKYHRVDPTNENTAIANDASIDITMDAAEVHANQTGTALVANKYEPEHIALTVTKAWAHGSNAANNPSETATVKIVATTSNNERIETAEEWSSRGYDINPVATLNGSYDASSHTPESAKAEWPILPKHMPGRVKEGITYSVEEVNVPDGYHVVYEPLQELSLGDTTELSIAIENVFEETSVSANKKWDDANNQDGLRHGVQYKLQWNLPDDDPDAGFVDVPDAGQESLNTSSDPVVQNASQWDADADAWTTRPATWNNLLAWKNNKRVMYRVVEVEAPVEGYTTTDTGSAYPSTLAYSAPATAASAGETPTYNLAQTITNAHTPQTYTEDAPLTFTKSWDHKGVIEDLPTGYDADYYKAKLRLWARVEGTTDTPVEVTGNSFDPALFVAGSSRNNDWRSHATVTGSGSYAVSIADLPKYKPRNSATDAGEKLEYFISEDEPTNYSMTTAAAETVTVDGHTYKLLKLPDNTAPVSCVAMANVRDTANLAITKSVVSELAADHNVPFTFTITSNPPISGLTANYTYTTTNALGNPANAGTITFANGTSSTITLYSGQTATIADLPVGVTYTVTEATDARFEETDDAELPATAQSALTKSGDTVSFTNTRKKGTLQITKTMESADSADATKDFVFTVTLGGLKVDPNLDSETKTFGGETFTKDENGKFVGKVTLHHGQTKTFDDLPIEATYIVTEAGDNDYTAQQSGDTGSIGATASMAAFVNTRKVGDFKIAKALTKAIPDDAGDKFYFDVTVKDATGNPLVLDLSAGAPDVLVGTTTLTADHVNTADPGNHALWYDATYSVIHNVFVEWSSAANADNSATVFGLPQGAVCTAEEKGFTVPANMDANNITMAAEASEQKTIANGSTQAVTLTNERATGDLVIKKVVVSPVDTEMNDTYDLTVTLKTKKSGTEVPLDGLVIKRLEEGETTPSEGTISFDSDGVATIEDVHHNETITIEGIPTEVRYTIAESGAENFTKHFEVQGANDQYAAIPVDGAEITKNTTSNARVRNVRNTGSLQVSKSVVSAIASDKQKDFSFTVVVTPPSTDSEAKLAAGTYGDVAFVNDPSADTYNTATFTLKDTEHKTISGLPTGWTYAVTEESETNFTTTPSGDTGTISSTQSAASFTNTRDTGVLVLNKELQNAIVSNAGGDDGDTFYFDVALVYGTGGSQETPVLDSLAPITISADGTDTVLAELASGQSPTEHQIYYDAEHGVIKNVPVVWHKADATATPAREAGGSTTISGLPVGVAYTASELTKAVGEPSVTVIDMAPNAFASHIEQGEASGTSGSIGSADSEASFANTRQVGSLQIGKSVVSDLADDHTSDFEFTVTAEPALSGEYNVSYVGRTAGEGDLTKLVFNNGTAAGTIKLADTQHITIEGLPTDVTYTITEAQADDFDAPQYKKGSDAYATATASAPCTCQMTKEQTLEVDFKNVRTTKDLVVAKDVHSTVQGDKQHDFKFVVTLGDTSITKAYDIVKHPATGSDTTGTLQFTAGVSAEFALKHGERLTIKDLPVTVDYTIREVTDGDEATNAAKFVAVDVVTGAIVNGTNAKTITNVRKTDTLTITKTLQNDIPTDEGDVFYFDVRLWGDDVPDGQTEGQLLALDSHAPITVKADGDTTGETVGTEQSGTRPLYYDAATGIIHNVPVVWHAANSTTEPPTPAGGSTTIEGLPLGATYVVTEQPYSAQNHTGVVTITTPTNITQASAAGNSNTVEDTSVDGHAGDNTAEFVNTRAQSGLSIRKTVVSPVPAEQAPDYDYTIVVSLKTRHKFDGEGNDYEPVRNIDATMSRYPAPASGTNSETLTFANGTETITIHHGETITITGIPTDVSYEVTESGAQDFTKAYSSCTGNIPDSGNAVAGITNTRKLGNLTVTKAVDSAVGSDASHDFHYTVTLHGPEGQTISSGQYPSTNPNAMEFDSNNTATFTLHDGESKTATGLPRGWTYTVAETGTGAEETYLDNFNTTWTREIGDGDEATTVKPNRTFAGFGNNVNTIDASASNVTCINTRKTGDLKLIKSVVSPFRTEREEYYDFTVNLNMPGSNGQPGEAISHEFQATGLQTGSKVTFTNGVATVRVRGIQTEPVVIKDVPLGAMYTVTEATSGQGQVYPGNVMLTQRGDPAYTIEGTGGNATADTRETHTIANEGTTYDVQITNARNGILVSIGKISAFKTVANELVPLEGAEFTLAPTSFANPQTTLGWTSVSLRSGADGRLYALETVGTAIQADDTKFNLAPGTYTLTETRAPTGYHKMSKPATIVVTEDFDVQYTDDILGSNGDVVNTTAGASETNPADRYVIVNVANSTGAELPSTGGAGTVAIYATGLALLFSAAVLGRARARRKE